METIKMVVCFASIFAVDKQKEILNQSSKELLVQKRYIDDVFSLWNKKKMRSTCSLKKSTDTTLLSELRLRFLRFLDTRAFEGSRLEQESILDLRTHFKPDETFQYKDFKSCHPTGVNKGFVKGDALRLLRTNSS